IQASHLSLSERRLLRLALNRLGEKGTWSFNELKLELEDLILEQIPIELSGFSSTEIDQILIGDEVAPLEHGPLAPQADATPLARMTLNVLLSFAQFEREV